MQAITDEPLEQRTPKRLGWGCSVLLLLVLTVAYILSPPFVLWILGREAYRNVVWIYTPLTWLLNSDLYKRYLEMFPDSVYQ